MASSKKIYLNIPTPCAENWDTMQGDISQRFCQNCQKNVVDFTNFSDTELYNYFKQNPHSCGRFYKDQLNRAVTFSKQQPVLMRKFSKFAAAVVTFFTLKNANAERHTSSNLPITYNYPRLTPKSKLTIDSNIIINGKVIDWENKPLQKAEIYWNGKPIAVTDTDGNFEFTPELSGNTKSYILEFVYPDFIKVVRNYHPAMGSTDFLITMYAPSSGGHFLMGAPIMDDNIQIDFPVLKYDYSSSELTDDNKMILSAVASKLRNHPGLIIELSGSGKDEREIKKMKTIQVALKNWLYNNEGISAERINLKTVAYKPAMRNIIEIKNCTKD